MAKLNMSKIRRIKEELDQQGNGNNSFNKLKKGKNVRRILPPKEGKELFFSEGYKHFNLGVDGKGQATCLDTFGRGDECPICKMVDRLKKTGSKEDSILADKMKKRKQHYVAVIDRDADNEEDKIELLQLPTTVLKAVINLICDSDYGDITDFNEGLDITITKDGEGLSTKYSVTPKRNCSVATEDFSEEELDARIPDLDKQFPEQSVEELERLLNGDSDEDDEEEDDDEEEEDSYSSHRKVNRHHEEEEEDDSDEDDEEEDSDEDDEEEEEELDYYDMSVSELLEEVKSRGIKYTGKKNKKKLIEVLEKDDEDSEEDDSEEDDDGLQDEITQSIAKKRKHQARK